MNDGSRVLVLLVTTPGHEVAEQLASMLVERRLAACVNTIPSIQSTYRWEGKVESEEESLLIIKTTTENLEEAEKAIIAAHPYDVPEVLAIPVSAGSPAYLSWLFRSCGDGEK